jgi:L-methionine (R)-S-oxide reductase
MSAPASSSPKADYVEIRKKFTALLGNAAMRTRTPWETKLASLIALLREGNPRVSWVGAYIERPAGSGVLWVDAYQGNVACLEIPSGKGVCGTAFARGEVLAVPDVDQFPGHIACDAAARSEIVLPLHRGTELVGVLDLDSHELAAFDANDAAGIGALLAVLNS